MKFGLVGPSYESQSVTADAQTTMNWIVEAIESGKGKSPAALYQTPGLLLFSALGGVSVRGIYSFNDRLFAVSGSTFFEIASDGTATDRGTISNDGLPVSFAASQVELFICSGGAGYIFNFDTNTLTPITTLLGPVLMGGYINGYFIALLQNDNRFQFSGLLNGLSWDGADVVRVSVFPGNLVSMLIDHQEMWMFGNAASQVYNNVTDPDNPFSPFVGGFIEQGCGAAFSPVKLDNSIYWLGRDSLGALIAWRAQGYAPSRVSNHAIEYEWQRYSVKDDARAYAYQQDGHSFWVISFPTADKTWVYDASTGMWAERGYWNTDTASYQRHRSQCHAYCFGKHLVGDWKTGSVYEMKTDVYTDGGDTIRRMRRAPHITANGKPVFVSELCLDVETGVGLQEGQGSDPQMMLRWSSDSGKTWGNEHWTSIGKVGEYSKRVKWFMLGMTRKSRVFELVFTDPAPCRIIDADIEVEVGG